MATLLGTTFGGNYITNEQGRQDHVANTLPSPYYRFDGDNDKVEITGSLVTNRLTDQVTVSCWFKPGADNYDTYRRLWAIGPNSNRAFQVHHNSGAASTTLALNGSGVATISTTKFTVGKWYHLVVTYNGARAETYINGVKGPGGAATGILNSSYNIVTIAREEGSGNYYWNGEIKDFRIYNVALDSTEVKEAYSGASVPFKYKGANQTAISDEAMTADDGIYSTIVRSTTSQTTVGGATATKITVDGTASQTHYLRDDTAPFVTEAKAIAWQADIYIPSANSLVDGVMFTIGQNGAGNTARRFIISTTSGGDTQISANTWTTVTTSARMYVDDGTFDLSVYLMDGASDF
jgi:hypothetical protein